MKNQISELFGPLIKGITGPICIPVDTFQLDVAPMISLQNPTCCRHPPLSEGPWSILRIHRSRLNPLIVTPRKIRFVTANLQHFISKISPAPYCLAIL